MPVHPESAMREDAGEEIATEDRTLKGRGQVRGKSKASRGFGRGMGSRIM